MKDRTKELKLVGKQDERFNNHMGISEEYHTVIFSPDGLNATKTPLLWIKNNLSGNRKQNVCLDLQKIKDLNSFLTNILKDYDKNK